MRRDMDLIRDMLLTTGDAPAPVDARTFVDDAHDWAFNSYLFSIFSYLIMIFSFRCMVYWNTWDY